MHDASLQAMMHALAGRVGVHRRGSMFGCPAVYVAGKLACCVYASTLAFKVPAPLAARLIAEGRGTWFQPYGKVRMREWIAIEVPLHGSTRTVATLMRAAFDHARSLGGEKGRRA